MCVRSADRHHHHQHHHHDHHHDHQAIGHVCEECGTILTGELFTLHGRVLCEADFKVWMIMQIVSLVN